MEELNDFIWVKESEPHRSRTREIIKKHPEVKKLIGKNPNTMYWILTCVFLQIGIAYFIKDYFSRILRGHRHRFRQSLKAIEKGQTIYQIWQCCERFFKRRLEFFS